MALSDTQRQEIDSLIRTASGGARGATQGDYDAWGAKQSDGRTYYDMAKSEKVNGLTDGVSARVYASPEFAGKTGYDPQKLASNQSGLGLQTALALDGLGLAGKSQIDAKGAMDTAAGDIKKATGVTPNFDYTKLGTVQNAINTGTPVTAGLGSALQPASQQVPFTASNSSVMDNISNVIKTDSPLMKMAETRAKQVANSRGLLNSSMAVQAGQDAILNVAMPIGQQQADQNFRSNEANLAFQRQNALQANDIRFQSAEKSLDRSLQEKLAGWQLNATEADNAARQVYGAQTLYQNTLVNINQNTALSKEAREQQIKAARDQLDTAMNLIEQIYRLNLNWAGTAA